MNRSDKIISAAVTVFGLFVGNFIYQMFLSEPNWLQAFDRSFFQAVAIALYIYLWVK